MENSYLLLGHILLQGLLQLQRPELLLLQRRAAFDLRERRDFESALRFAKSPLPILGAPACNATTLRFS